MVPYSHDLRRRIVEAYESGEYTLVAVAELFRVSLATVKNFVGRNRTCGWPDALPHGGGRKPVLSEKARLFIREALQHDTDLTLEELRRRVHARHKQPVSRPTLCRLLPTLDLPRKKSRSTPANAIRQGSSRLAPSTRKPSSASI